MSALLLLCAGVALAQPAPEPRTPLTAIGEQQQAATAVPSGQVRRLQQRLAELGYDPGPVDGLMGPRTRRAIRAWQEDHGLEPTGEPSPDLRERVAAARAPAAAPLTEAERRLAAAERLRPYVLGVQAELREHGFYVGPPIDGITPHLRQAIREYQRQAGLAPTGEISQALLDHLRFARPEVRAALSE